MSAIADNTDGPVEVVKVLFALFPQYNTLDVAGPLEVLNRSLHDAKDKCMFHLFSASNMFQLECSIALSLPLLTHPCQQPKASRRSSQAPQQP
jgi:hypothetical protein